MSVKIKTAAGLIAASVISGLTIRDLDEIKELMQPRDLPCLMPHPRDFMTGFETIPESLSGSYADEKYTLHYRLYYTPVTGNVKFFGPYADMMTIVEAILNKFITTNYLSGSIYIKPRVLFLGGVDDHAGNIYHGGDIAFDITEMYEVT